MYAVIMAGGLGTRLSSVYSDIPKALVPIGGKSILEHQLDNLKSCGITDIIIITGHLGNKIIEYFGQGEKYGVKIEYIQEDTPLGTAGGLYYLKDKIRQDFFLINGDIIFNCDLNRFLNFHKRNNSDISLFVHPNNHPYDSVLVEHDENGKVVSFVWKELKRDGYYHNSTNAGIHILSPKTLDFFNKPKKIDLDREVINHYIKSGNVFAYTSPEYVKDMGTPDRLAEIEMDYKNGKVQNRNLINKQKCIFLDRDGTINKLNGFISKHEDLEIIEEAYEAISCINKSQYLCIVITNQPVIARGECTYKELDTIHKKMETLLGERGCYIDGLYYCPHHPQKGFDGEISELKINCECRKPKTGLFIKAQRDFNIDFKSSFMIGDSPRDIEAGNALNMKTCAIGIKGNTLADFYGANILDLVSLLLKT